MKKKVLLSVAAIAVLVASLAINLNTNKNTSTNVNLAELVQTASADEYWTFTICPDPYMGQSWMLEEPHWWLGAMYDVPVDYCSGPVECCLAGGMDPCQVPIHIEEVFDGYDSHGQDIKVLKEGRWIGGQDIDLARDPLMWNPSMFNIIRTLNMGSYKAHQVK